MYRKYLSDDFNMQRVPYGRNIKFVIIHPSSTGYILFQNVISVSNVISYRYLKLVQNIQSNEYFVSFVDTDDQGAVSI